MPIISYAQNFEDVMLWRALHDVQNGFYIDVGANHPVVDSVTKAFYDSGWSGINLEPMAQYHELLVVERPRDVCLQLAAGTHEGEMTFFEIEGTGLSTAFELIAEKHLDNLGYEHRQVTVQVQTLARICEDHCDGPIHFLKIDVEGGEADVISGMNLQTYRPWIMVIEAVEPMEQTLRSGAWRPEIEAQGYEFCYFDGLNEYFLAEEQSERRRFFQTPPNVFDSFRLSETHWSRPPALDDLEEEAERLNSQLAELIDRLKGKHQAQAELTKRLENRICELEQQSSELAEKRKAILLLEEELEGLQLRFSESQEACSGLQSELQGVLSSRSWKITRPLRALRSKVKPRG